MDLRVGLARVAPIAFACGAVRESSYVLVPVCGVGGMSDDDKSQRQEMFVTAGANPKAHLQDNFEPSRTLTHDSNPQPQEIPNPNPQPRRRRRTVSAGAKPTFRERMF
jgi:hypothetical protein